MLTVTPLVSHATLLEVSIDTTAYDGTDGVLAFDFLDGDGLVNNSVTVSNFYTNGTLGGATPTGSVSGSLVPPDSLILDDTDFYNSFSQDIRFGTAVHFTLGLSEQGSGSATPDSFALFLLSNSR
jgi:hypothetical protein